MSLSGYITNSKHFLKPFFFRTVADCGIRQTFVDLMGMEGLNNHPPMSLRDTPQPKHSVAAEFCGNLQVAHLG
jgi:hypothetical protein